MKKLFCCLPVIFVLQLVACFNAHAQPTKKGGYLELRVYHFNNNQQENLLDNFLQKNLLPFLHQNGLSNIGVFKAIANDTSVDKRIYVLIPFKTAKQWEKYVLQKSTDPSIVSANEYVGGTNDNASFTRTETIFLKGFKYMTGVHVPKLSSPKNERVYELRSYESPSEKLHVNKVHMFNEGGEVKLFSRLGFNAVFYGSVLHGARMPNLMYITAFENKKARDEHWAAFRDDAEWKVLSAKKEYQKNVNKNEIVFLRPTDYSDL